MKALAFAVLAIGCGSGHLLKSTTTYSAASAAVTRELAATSDIVTTICHERAEIEFLTYAITRPASFSSFFTQERHALPDSPDHLTATWKDQCDAYRVGDDTFASYVLAISHYAAALGAFAADNQDAGASLTALAKQVGGSVATNVPAAGPYKSILSGVGEPLGRVESILQARWKADTIGSLVGKTDPDIQVILAALHAYVVAIQKAEIRDARESLLDLIAARQTPTDVSPPLAVEVRVSTAFIDVELEGRLQESERRLAALARLIENLQAAHARLARGWAAGESDDGAATLREINSIAERLEADFKAFENPVKGAGS